MSPGGDKLPPKRPLMTENILRQSREAESALADALVSLFFACLLLSFSSHFLPCGFGLCGLLLVRVYSFCFHIW